MMIIDLSQAAVNKTAMFWLSRDTADVLSVIRPSVQYFGHVFEEQPAPRHLELLREQGLRRLLSHPDRLLSEVPMRDPLADDIVLYLDPLYVLAGGLTSKDVVMVLDLSTVTHPHWHAANVAEAYVAAFTLIAREKPRLLAISRNTADSLHANYGIPRDSVEVVPLYVPDHLGRDPTEARIRPPFPYVLFVGSLETRKNLVGAIAIFRSSGLAQSGYRLLIVGGNGHGEHNVRAAAANDPSIIFAGYVTNGELNSLYANAAAFLYPSYLEGFGVPLLEAMAFGVPAVASASGACSEVGGDLVRCYDPDDHHGFARELVRLVKLRPPERKRYREAARAWIEGRYTRRAYAERLLRLMKQFGAVPAAGQAVFP